LSKLVSEVVYVFVFLPARQLGLHFFVFDLVALSQLSLFEVLVGNKRIVVTMSTKSTSSSNAPLKKARVAPVEEHEEKTKEALKRVGGTLKEEEAARVEFRRAANRLHACKSRQRSKNFRSELKLEISQLKQDKEELERANAVLSGKIEILMSENQQLGLNHQMLVQQRGNASGNVGSYPPMFQQQRSQQMGFTPGMMQWQ
jgi:hypothetical protein